MNSDNQDNFKDEEGWRETVADAMIGRHIKAKDSDTLSAFMQRFDQTYPTKEHCIEAIFQKIQTVRPFKCASCGSTALSRKFGDRKARCIGCPTVYWFTAGSAFFGKMKAPRARLAMIELFAQDPFFNAHAFAKTFKISCNTSWKMKKKLLLVLRKEMQLDDAVTSIDSIVFHSITTRRSRLTPGSQPAIAEEFLLEQTFVDKKNEKGTVNAESSNHEICEDNGDQKDELESAGKLLTTGKEIESLLGDVEASVIRLITKKPIWFDALADAMPQFSTSQVMSAITMLEITGKITVLPGGLYVLKKADPIIAAPKLSRIVGADFGDCLSTLGDYFEQLIATLSPEQLWFFNVATTTVQIQNAGVSRKYLDLTLTYVCYLINWLRSKGSISVFDLCIRAQNVSDQDLKAFNTPLQAICYAAA